MIDLVLQRHGEKTCALDLDFLLIDRPRLDNTRSARRTSAW